MHNTENAPSITELFTSLKKLFLCLIKLHKQNKYGRAQIYVGTKSGRMTLKYECSSLGGDITARLLSRYPTLFQAKLEEK